jgi:hypothetical protein
MSQQSQTRDGLCRREAATGLADLQGYLMVHAALHEAHMRAAAFADSMPWLGTAEREEVIRLYAADDIARTRHAWETIGRRARELSGEYTARYEELRRRMWGRNVIGWILNAVVMSAVCALLVLYR